MVPLRRVGWLASLAVLTLTSCGGGDPSRLEPLVRESAAETATTPPVEPSTTALAPTSTDPPPLSVPPIETTTTTPPPPPTTAPPVTVAAASAKALASPLRVVGDIAPYAGLGTWVDVYDWSHYKGTTPTVGPDQVDQMAAEGVQTLFIQTAKHDTPDMILERDLLDPIVARAHQRGMRVVAWYLPTLDDVDNDLDRLLASAALDVDGLAVDIESRKVADPGERSLRLVDLSRRLREALPGRAIGAIVMPPVQLEVVNPNFWPGFPWREIAPSYDVWQTMGYWTDRKQSSGYRDPYVYTDENLRRLRNNLGDPTAPVSPVGGVGALGNGDIEAFLRAAVENRAIGGSIYDWRTTEAGAWPALRGFRTA
ncbi:MAG TPA: hypothetical protein VM933_02990 [Acidimicrobiales bacterium]|nr:hypothetical protein [Acidimicrobiales bacterium]